MGRGQQRILRNQPLFLPPEEISFEESVLIPKILRNFAKNICLI
jgi:hypothetical protein